MSNPVEICRLLADPTRLRISNLLLKEELSVNELCKILGMAQSRVSTHLSILRKGGLVSDRKDGKRSYYSIASGLNASSRTLLQAIQEASLKDPDATTDEENLQRILESRRRKAEAYFNEIAGKLDRQYCPGRSWEAIGHLLLCLVPEWEIVDLGAGEGTLSHLLARRARTVYCIDHSERMVEVGTALARRHDLDNVIYKLGDIEDVPMEDQSVDCALLSQALHHARHPQKALREAFRILRPGGLLLVLDLKEHQFEKARELYADEWLGFSENTLFRYLREAGFQSPEVAIVARESKPPCFETLLAHANRPREMTAEASRPGSGKAVDRGS